MSFPRHIAIIMDGNGRYAKKRGFADRTKGHEEGANTVRVITTHCAEIGIEVLTLYAFSTENWDRPKSEVSFLMKMLDRYLKNELKTLTDNNIRFFAIGDLAKLPKHLQDRISKTIEATADNSAMTQVLALNYGAKDEIVRAANKIRSNEITKEALNDALYTASFPDVDMLIRTGGEQRLSNFLLWQCAYTELFFTPTLWPEFNAIELDKTIEDFQKRERRFGGV
ncbi:MAG: di-trans,poly-cis-decaprenylcistransferase [Helicobacteraceae bacterium]|jgi:undecaprenyl diphosphate synthase|nr:di-trans,poly-cis-decaprenylcistransferase [Helicobacteraceae bacterium]